MTDDPDDGPMNTMPVLSFDLEVRPLAAVGEDAVERFAADLRNERRFAGRPPARGLALLTHPSQPTGAAAFVDDELVGLARLTRLTAAGRDFYVAVAAPWRRLGVGARLVGELETVADARGERLARRPEQPVVAVRTLPERTRGATVDGVGALAGLLLFRGRVA